METQTQSSAAELFVPLPVLMSSAEMGSLAAPFRPNPPIIRNNQAPVCVAFGEVRLFPPEERTRCHSRAYAAPCLCLCLIPFARLHRTSVQGRICLLQRSSTRRQTRVVHSRQLRVAVAPPRQTCVGMATLGQRHRRGSRLRHCQNIHDMAHFLPGFSK